MATIEELEARLAELEARLGPVPQAVAPITIGELTDVPTPGAPIASQWANEVTNRIVQRFASSAARSGATWPGLAKGALSYLATGNDTEGPELWNGTAWRRPWNMPHGRQAFIAGFAQVTASAGADTVLMTSPAFNAPGNRVYRITSLFTGVGSVNADAIRFATRRGTLVTSPSVNIQGLNVQQNGFNLPFVIVAYDTPPASATLQYCISAARLAGTGNFTMLASSSYDNSIAIEDVGPAVGVAPT